MKRFVKIVFIVSIILALIPISFDIVGAVLDKKFDNYYRPCVVAKGKTTEWDSECYEEYFSKHPTLKKISDFMIEPGFGLFAPEFGLRFMLGGGCVKTDTKLKDGMTAKGRDYFRCNKVQIFISDIIYGPNGERL